MSTPIINTDLYPVDDLLSDAARSSVKRVRDSLDQDGSCTLPNFVTAQALTEMARQAISIAHLAYPGPTEVSPYFFNYQLGKG